MAGPDDERYPLTEYLHEYSTLSGDPETGNKDFPPHSRAALPGRLKALPNGTPLVLMCFFFPALCGFLFGYDIGTTSGTYELLKREGLLADNNLEKSFYTSGSLLGASVGSVVAYLIGDFTGRRRLLMLSCVLYAIGASITGAAGGQFAKYILVTGHVVYGLGIAFAMHSAPLYIAETAPPSWRGTLVSLKELFIVGGIAIGNLFALTIVQVMGTTGAGWRILPLFSAALAVVAFCGIACLPATPRWLMLRSVNATTSEARDLYLHEAREGLCKLQVKRPEEVNETLADIRDSVVSNKQGGGGWRDLWTSKSQVIVGVGLLVLQQVTGQPTILYTLNSIIMNAANLDQHDLSTSLIIGSGVTVFKLIATLICVFTVEKFGRRRLLLIGTWLMLIPLLVLGASKQYEFISGTTIATAINNPLVCFSLLLIVTAYQIGFGPVNWLIISEIFPLGVRSRAQGIAVFANFISNYGTTAALPFITDGMDSIGVSFWWLYAFMTVVSIVFVFVLVPETKGKRIEDIEALFKKLAFRA